MKSLLNSFVLAATLFSTAAQADIWLRPGETQWVAGGQYVTCQGGPGGPGGPGYPGYPQRIYVRADVACLDAIPRTDGRSLANLANSCDVNNLRNYGITNRCRLVRQLHNPPLFERIYAKRTSLLYDDQIRTLQNACSDKEYECN